MSEGLEFKGGNPMRLDILGSPDKSNIRRPQHSTLDIDLDGSDTPNRKQNSTRSVNKVAKPPRPMSRAVSSNQQQQNGYESIGTPPPPPVAPRRMKSSADVESNEQDLEMAAVYGNNDRNESNNRDSSRQETENKLAKPRKEKSNKERPRSVKRDPKSPTDSSKETTNIPVTTAAASSGRDNNKDDTKNRFIGANLVQYGLWAHYLSYGAAMMCACMGAFAIAWNEAHTYHCRINGELINSMFLYDAAGNCPTTFTSGGVVKTICCDSSIPTDIQGYSTIGAIYIVYAIFIVVYENTTWGFGLWFPNDTLFYRYRISPIGILHIILGIAGLYNYATCLAGSFLLVAGIVYQYAVMRYESGDGGRAQRRKQAENAKKNNQYAKTSTWDTIVEYTMWAYHFNPITFIKRIYNEDKLSSYFWVFILCAANIILWVHTAHFWYYLVSNMNQQLKDGTLDVYCSTRLCHTNRKVVRYGPFSIFAAIAKASGACLNLNSALILFPVIKMLLSKLNNSGVSFTSTQRSNDYFGKFFARPLTRYVPLSKNIEFHKLCAMAIFFFSWLHLIGHMLNLIIANNATLAFFRQWGWDGTQYLFGAIVSFAMFIIYSAAPDIVRYTKFEIFFNSHHFFVIFFVIMFLHGPVFFYWCVLPVLLYIFERYMQLYRGNRPFSVVKVEWIPPVMAIYFRPINKEDFVFREGQYLYLNCPYISASEWHPMTISSASDDLHNGPRIHLETGEEVMEVPRPKGLPSNAKWNKYCLVSRDWTMMDPNDYLDKSETGYNDFVSCHVKVHGLEEPTARTWTRKLKEYFELMSPGKKFPFYFYKRDNRGDIIIGRQHGPDGRQILCVDGPHSAPSEHYPNYGTVMLIGAGIGLTPCASILCALTKYRWKKNFNPELLHFYWVVRQNEVDSFQWLVHMLTELSFELKKSKQNGQIERKYYCEINIYVTGVDKKPREVLPLFRPKKTFHSPNCTPNFTADELYSKMLNPTVDSRGQIKKMRDPNAENRLQDIWIWNGRPHWDEVFREMKDQRQHSDIGVCFCGAPVIGADLKTMCEKYSNAAEDCLFSLHKENF